jgi:hypothetical protein
MSGLGPYKCDTVLKTMNRNLTDDKDEMYS